MILFLSNCYQTAEEKVSSLHNSWLEQDTVLISTERLQLRYEKALEFIETHRLYGVFDEEACFTQQIDSLRETRRSFFVVQQPLPPRKNEFLKSENLMKKWSCEVYKEPFDSLWIQKSEYIRSYSRENKLLYEKASSVFNSVNDWQEKNSEELKRITTNILNSLNTDRTINHFVIFEVPTGISLTAYVTYYMNPYEENELYKTDPSYILYRTVSADEVLFIFNKEDEIQDVWLSYWIR